MTIRQNRSHTLHNVTKLITILQIIQNIYLLSPKEPKCVKSFSFFWKKKFCWLVTSLKVKEEILFSWRYLSGSKSELFVFLYFLFHFFSSLIFFFFFLKGRPKCFRENIENFGFMWQLLFLCENLFLYNIFTITTKFPKIGKITFRPSSRFSFFSNA